jgi:hypothetical protein
MNATAFSVLPDRASTMEGVSSSSSRSTVLELDREVLDLGDVDVLELLFLSVQIVLRHLVGRGDRRLRAGLLAP